MIREAWASVYCFTLFSLPRFLLHFFSMLFILVLLVVIWYYFLLFVWPT